MYFVRYWGVRCVPLVFLSLKVIASGGGGGRARGGGGRSPPDPAISQLYNVRLYEPLGDIGNKICPILVKQKSFSSNVALFF